MRRGARRSQWVRLGFGCCVGPGGVGVVDWVWCAGGRWVGGSKEGRKKIAVGEVGSALVCWAWWVGSSGLGFGVWWVWGG